MTDMSPGNDPQVGPGRDSPPARPRWVKVFAIIAVALVVCLVIILTVAGGKHGPSRHLPENDSPEGHALPRQHIPQKFVSPSWS